MRGTAKEKKPTGTEAITELLRWIDGETTEASELFDQWAKRRKYRFEGEHKLAEEHYQQEQAFRRRLKYFRRKKFIKTKKTEKKLLFELTDRGREELLKRLVQERPKLQHDQVCLVLYDIPVAAGSGRDGLRYFLKRIGFKHVQQSVWQTDKDVIEEVLAFVRSANVEKWVQVYLAQRKG
ncbi:hypothetical protein EPN81_00165 [Patescibacteria group bacterium]|nr:MAG: hypothetical protein EPN81_00165 [Patescibacteria group bacterium]